MTDIVLFDQYLTSDKSNPEMYFAMIPLNLIYVASYLNRHGLPCKIHQLGIFDPSDVVIEDDRVRCGLPDSAIKEIIENERPKIVGLGGMYSRHYRDVISICRLVKMVDPSISVVVGGNHATDYWEMVLKEESIDFVVCGEGEITFFELCQAILKNGQDFSDINGIAYRRKAETNAVRNEDRELLKDLDELPPADYSLVDVNKYAQNSYKSPYLMRYPCIGIVTSRGCPSKCVFCTVKAVWGRTWRGHSPKRVVDEIEALKRDFGIEEFSFYDDSASLSKKRWRELCEEIIRRDLDIRWTTPNGIAHWTLDREIITTMRRSGCYRLTFGIESGNLETRKFIKKDGYKLSQAEDLIKHANKLGMWTICTNIVGFPYETSEQIRDTIEFSKKSQTDFATFYLLAPHVASDVYQYFRDEELIDFDSIFNENVFDMDKYNEMNSMLNEGGIPTKYFNSVELKEIQRKAYQEFIFYRALSYLVFPYRILRKIRSIEDLHYTHRLIMTGARLLLRSFKKNTTRTLLYTFVNNLNQGKTDTSTAT